MNLTEQQDVIVSFCKTGTGNGVVIARAGSGKTFTLRQAAKVMRGSKVITSFNKKIVKEIENGLRKDGTPNCTVGTVHSLGFSAIRQAYPNVRVEGKRSDCAGYFKFERIVSDIVATGQPFPKSFHGFVQKAVSLAKQRGLGIETHLFTKDAWLDIVNHFNLEQELGDEYAAEIPTGEDPITFGLRLACLSIKRGIELAEEVIDFDDMLYMPLVWGLRMQQYDWVLVDEAQDTNPARRILIRRLMKEGGRALFVGDPKQAIYGFTGADNDAIQQIITDFSAVTMSLTKTFRCGRKIVALAKKYASDIEAASNNPDGEIIYNNEGDFWKNVSMLTAKDAILCRNTKPLVETAFGLIRKGIACHVEGRDIGLSILRLINRWKSVKTLDDLRDRLVDYREKEVAKLLAKGAGSMASVIEDRVETVFALMDGLAPAATLADLRNMVERMFADTPDGKPADRVRLMTLHRSKGLEFPRVFLWGANKYQPSRYATMDWEMEQENNLTYVGITRAERTLVWVSVGVTESAVPQNEQDFHNHTY